MHSDHRGPGHGVWVTGAISRSERIHLFPGEFHTFCGLKEGYSLCVRVITGKLCGIDECRVAFAQVWPAESLSPGKCDAPTMARRPHPLRGISIIFCCTSRSTKPTGFLREKNYVNLMAGPGGAGVTQTITTCCQVTRLTSSLLPAQCLCLETRKNPSV